MKNKLRILFFADIMGSVGRKAVAGAILDLKPKYEPHVIIANVENATHGFGIIEKHFAELRGLGIHVMTSGNHIWDQKEAGSVLNAHSDVLIRPGNYPSFADTPCPGAGYTFYHFSSNAPPLAVINVQGRIFMSAIDCPIQYLEDVLTEIRQKTPLVFVDFHAETTSEKMATAHYFDGDISAFIGTHTHVQTADARILPGGTAYLTDVGICGSHLSTIGMRPAASIFRLRTGRPAKFEVSDQDPSADAVVIDIDIASGKALSIEAIYGVQA